jgi:hypothetical protein
MRSTTWRTRTRSSCIASVFNASEQALKTLALNPDWLGGQIGMSGVLHTWMRNMGYHVHVHYLVPAGGIEPLSGA